MKVTSNAAKIAGRLRQRINRWDKAMRTGLRKIVTRVDKAQVDLLSGSNDAAPGSYKPVPNRTGTLMQGHFFEVRSASLAVAGNTTAYALPIHSGEMKTKQGLSYALPPRPFLDDAAAEADHLAIMATEIHRSAMAL